MSSKLKKWPKTKIIGLILLILLSICMLYPLFLIINLSVLSDKAFAKNPSALAIGDAFFIGNFALVFEKIKAFDRFFNSLWMTAISCVINTALCMLAAFPLSRNHFRSSKLTYIIILLSMYLPGSLVANIILLNDILHIYGSPIALILMWSIGSMQMNVFMMVGFVKTLPVSLDEAAFIDGCGYFKYIFVIALPLLKPIIATILVFKAVGCWNDFVGPMLYLKGEQFRPMAVGLFFFRGSYSSQWNQFSAVIILMALPMVILYSFAQKYIIEGMVAGAIKG